MDINLSGESRVFPIIGEPIKFVKSPQSLTASFGAKGHSGICIPLQVPKDALDAVMQGLTRTQNVDGLLVTMPHKEAAFRYCTTSSAAAGLLHSVSVMRRNADNTWHGDMLDGQAFVKAQIDAGANPDGATVLLIGAGSAGAAIAFALLEAGVRELRICDSDGTRVQKLTGIASKAHRDRMIAWPADPRGCEMVCNATPLGLHPEDLPPVDLRLLASFMFVGDVIAGHGVTPLLKAARAAGCKTADGSQMVDAVQEMMVSFMLGN
jgi:shikimate dehydrogenase